MEIGLLWYILFFLSMYSFLEFGQWWPSFMLHNWSSCATSELRTFGWSSVNNKILTRGDSAKRKRNRDDLFSSSAKTNCYQPPLYSPLVKKLQK